MPRINSSHIEYGDQDQTTLAKTARFAEIMQAMFLRRKLSKQYGSEAAIPEHLYPYTTAERQLKIFGVLRQIMEQVAHEMGLVPDFSKAYTSMLRLEGGNFRQYSHAEREALAQTTNPYDHCYKLLLRSSDNNAIAQRLNRYQHRRLGHGVGAFVKWVAEQDASYTTQINKLQEELV